MAWTFILVDGTNTLNLNDNVNYQVNIRGFYAPPPPRITSYSGQSFFRHGADLIARSYGNRQVTIDLSIMGTNASDLGTMVQNIWGYLRKATEFAKDAVGTRIQLRYQWEGATGTYLFNIIEGNLDLGRDLHNAYLLKGTRAQHAILDLVCEPFITQASETIQNYAPDPSFEIANTPLADWGTVSSGSPVGTSVRTTAQAKYGTASLSIAKTGGNGFMGMTATGTAASGQAWSVSVWMYIQSIQNPGTTDARFNFYFLDTTGGILQNNQFLYTATTTGFVLRSTSNLVAPSATTNWRIRFLFNDNGSGNTGTFFVDGVMIAQASALPTAWISGNAITNHFDDNGQAHINYVDVYDVPGDVPAPAQIRVLEATADKEFWIGARHDKRQADAGLFIEGESFTSTIGAGWTGTSLTTASNGSVGGYPQAGGAGGTAGTAASMTSTSGTAPQVVMYNIATPPQGQFRVLARVSVASTPFTAFWGLGYQYGGVTKDPSTTAQYKGYAQQISTLLDLGVLTIPPNKIPDSGTVGTFGIRIAHYVSSVTANTPFLDFVSLIPVDAGGGYVSKATAIDNLWVDSITQPNAIYRVSTAGIVQGIPPDQVGSPPLIHPKGSRFYFHFSPNATADTGSGGVVSIRYYPRYLHVGT